MDIKQLLKDVRGIMEDWERRSKEFNRVYIDSETGKLNANGKRLMKEIRAWNAEK